MVESAEGNVQRSLSVLQMREQAIVASMGGRTPTSQRYLLLQSELTATRARIVELQGQLSSGQIESGYQPAPQPQYVVEARARQGSVGESKPPVGSLSASEASGGVRPSMLAGSVQTPQLQQAMLLKKEAEQARAKAEEDYKKAQTTSEQERARQAMLEAQRKEVESKEALRGGTPSVRRPLPKPEVQDGVEASKLKGSVPIPETQAVEATGTGAFQKKYVKEALPIIGSESVYMRKTFKPSKYDIKAEWSLHQEERRKQKRGEPTTSKLKGSIAPAYTEEWKALKVTPRKTYAEIKADTEYQRASKAYREGEGYWLTTPSSVYTPKFMGWLEQKLPSISKSLAIINVPYATDTGTATTAQVLTWGLRGSKIYGEAVESGYEYGAGITGLRKAQAYVYNLSPRVGGGVFQAVTEDIPILTAKYLSVFGAPKFALETMATRGQNIKEIVAGVGEGLATEPARTITTIAWFSKGLIKKGALKAGVYAGVVDKSFLVAHGGEGIPYKPRMQNIQDLFSRKTIVTTTGRRRLGTHVPSTKTGSHIESTYGVPMIYATYMELKSRIAPVGALFLGKLPFGEFWKEIQRKRTFMPKVQTAVEYVRQQLSPSKLEVERTKVQRVPKDLLENIKRDLIKKGKTSEANIKKLYTLAQEEATRIKKPVATISPKTLRGFKIGGMPQSEFEVIRILPKNYKAPTLKFSGFTTTGALIFKGKGVPKSPVSTLKANLAFKSNVAKFFKARAEYKLGSMLGKIQNVPYEYGKHGKEHLFAVEKRAVGGIFHDILKVGEKDEFPEFQHGETFAWLASRGQAPKEFYAWYPKSLQRKVAGAVSAHEYVRPITSLFTSTEGGLFEIPSAKTVLYSARNLLKREPLWERMASADRQELSRFGIDVHPSLLFHVEDVTRTGELIKPARTVSPLSAVATGLMVMKPQTIYEKFGLEKPLYEKLKEQYRTEANVADVLKRKYGLNILEYQAKPTVSKTYKPSQVRTLPVIKSKGLVKIPQTPIEELGKGVSPQRVVKVPKMPVTAPQFPINKKLQEIIERETAKFKGKKEKGIGIGGTIGLLGLMVLPRELPKRFVKIPISFEQKRYLKAQAGVEREFRLGLNQGEKFFEKKIGKSMVQRLGGFPEHPKLRMLSFAEEQFYKEGIDVYGINKRQQELLAKKIVSKYPVFKVRTYPEVLRVAKYPRLVGKVYPKLYARTEYAKGYKYPTVKPYMKPYVKPYVRPYTPATKPYVTPYKGTYSPKGEYVGGKPYVKPYVAKYVGGTYGGGKPPRTPPATFRKIFLPIRLPRLGKTKLEKPKIVRVKQPKRYSPTLWASAGQIKAVKGIKVRKTKLTGLEGRGI